jgi:hypothetical protein
MLHVDTSVAWALLLLTVSGSTPGATPRPQKPARDGTSGSGGGGGSSFPPHVTFQAAARRDTQCKNCPYERCLNALVLTNGSDVEYSCYTLGEPVNLDQYAPSPRQNFELTTAGPGCDTTTERNWATSATFRPTISPPPKSTVRLHTSAGDQN